MQKFDFSIFNSKKELETSLKHTKKNYRPYDPGSYLYRKVVEYKFANKFSDDFIELLYVTLAAWNMNSRGAKLEEFPTFCKSIKKYQDDFEKLSKLTIGDIDGQKEILRKLFFELKLVAPEKPPLVTFSKTLHFILPNLIAPIDRRYTIRFFYGNSNNKCFKSSETQFETFWEIESAFSKFAKTKDLSQYIDDVWNRNIPKIMDNAIIGKISIEREKEKQESK